METVRLRTFKVIFYTEFPRNKKLTMIFIRKNPQISANITCTHQLNRLETLGIV